MLIFGVKLRPVAVSRLTLGLQIYFYQTSVDLLTDTGLKLQLELSCSRYTNNSKFKHPAEAKSIRVLPAVVATQLLW